MHRLDAVTPAAAEMVAGEGLNPQRKGGTTASPFVGGSAEPAADLEPMPVHRSRFKFPRHGRRPSMESP